MFAHLRQLCRSSVLVIVLAGLLVGAPLASHVLALEATPPQTQIDQEATALYASVERECARPLGGAARLFAADDPDPASIGAPIGKQTGGILSAVVESPVSESDAAAAIDVYMLSTTPSEPVGGETLQEYRVRQLASVERSNTTSVWPATAPRREDSRYIKDAGIAFMGTTHGAQAQLPDANIDGSYLIAPSGEVFQFVDYRVEQPEDTTETSYDRETKRVTVTANAVGKNESVTESRSVVFRTPYGDIRRSVSVTASPNETRTRSRTFTETVGGERIHTTYELTDYTETRTVRLGAESWSEVTGPDTPPRSARQIEYSNASVAGTGQTTLRLEASIRVTVIRTRETYDYNPVDDEWIFEKTVQFPLGDELTVHDSRRAVVVPSDSVTIRQRVIQRSHNQNVLVLTITGPRQLSHRVLWNRGTLSGTTNQTLTNIWGVYATRQYHEGYRTSNQNSEARTISFPPTLELWLTARQSSPQVTLVGEPTTTRLARVSTTEHQRIPEADRNATLPACVNLSTAVPTLTTHLVIRDAPGQLQGVNDIFGDEISVTTTEHAYRQSTLTYTWLPSRDDDAGVNDRKRIRLWLESSDGKPLANRTLYLDGAVSATAVTDARGATVITMTEPTVTASFRGDPWTDLRAEYYGPSYVTVVSSSVGELIPVLGDFVRVWELIVIPLVLGIALAAWRLSGSGF